MESGGGGGGGGSGCDACSIFASSGVAFGLRPPHMPARPKTKRKNGNAKTIQES